MHGRVEGAAAPCAVPGCTAPGEYRAPLLPSDFDGPGAWRLLCLDHVRAHNASYNYFSGMSAEQIQAAQGPHGGWDRATRAFAVGGGDPPPAWSDFADPLEAIAGRFARARQAANGHSVVSRFSKGERQALAVLGLDQSCDRTALRRRYSELVRRFHPDRNGGDRRFEARLREVISAYQQLKGAAAFA